jgi:group II intron reverse transcriptase/maturase
MRILRGAGEGMATANNPTDKARALQHALYVAAKQSHTRRFHALYDRIAQPHILREAWQRVKRNRGAAGIDGETIEAIVALGEEQMLAELRDLLVEGRYRPQPVRRVHIPKPGRPAERRPLGIPRVRDRVVQTAVRLVLEPIFEASFRDCSYGFRPRRNAHQAMERIRTEVNAGKRWIVEIDFADYFGSLDHELLLRLVARRISDRRVLRLIRLMLTAGVMEDGRRVSSVAGTPQGGTLSPLLSNVYGHALDALWEKEAGHLGTFIRYADDGVVLCRTQADAEAALRWLQRRAVGLHLTLHPEKTRLVYLGDGRQGFDFLGFHVRMVMSWRWRRRYCQRWPSARAMTSIRQRIREITAPRHKLKHPIGDLVAELNPVLRGWGQYFRVGNSARKFSQLDSYVQERLALFDSKKRRKHGRRWGQEHDYAWYRSLAVHRLSGSIRYATATTVT